MPSIKIDCTGRDDEEILLDIIRQVYDIETDDRLIRESAASCDIERAKNFDALRKNYRTRREFMNTSVNAIQAGEPLYRKLRGLGFQIT